VELSCRTPLLVALVNLTGINSLTAQGLLLALAFGARFLFSRHLLYRLSRVRLPRPRTERGVSSPSGFSGLLTVEDILVSDRPWGQFEQFCLNEQVTVKLITVHPGSRLSLQTHVHREEFWQVLDVPLDVTVGDTTWTADVGERVLVKAGEAHRLGNPGTRPGRVLELARGHFDEEDVVRLDDDYARAGEGRAVLRRR
jgi:mannose-1-phosphate guanylyltransferase/mannose-6-phosphate isomerase